jgi:uncharacterized protein YuzE
MKVTYDPEVDVLRILLHSGPIEESDESKPGIILDYDKTGNVVGMEILDASKRTDNPQTMEYSIAMHAQSGATTVSVHESRGPKYGSARSDKRRSKP